MSSLMSGLLLPKSGEPVAPPPPMDGKPPGLGRAGAAGVGAPGVGAVGAAGAAPLPALVVCCGALG